MIGTILAQSGETSALAILLAAALPCLFMAWMIVRQQGASREPISLLANLYLVSILLTLILGNCWSLVGLGSVQPDGTTPNALALAFGRAAIPEELLKLAVLWLVLRNSPYLRDAQSGFLFGAITGLGFASAENIGYVLSHGLEIAPLRAMIAAPLHTAWAALVGTAWGHARFRRTSAPEGVVIRAWPYVIPALLVSIGLHGLFDFELFVENTDSVMVIIAWGASLGIAVLAWLVAVRLVPRRTPIAMLSRACPLCRELTPVSATECIHCDAAQPTNHCTPMVCSHCVEPALSGWKHCAHCGASFHKRYAKRVHKLLVKESAA